MFVMVFSFRKIKTFFGVDLSFSSIFEKFAISKNVLSAINSMILKWLPSMRAFDVETAAAADACSMFLWMAPLKAGLQVVQSCSESAEEGGRC